MSDGAHQPTHPGLVQVDRRSGDFASSLLALQSFSAGQIICPIDNTRPAPKKAYTSVQVRAAPLPLPQGIGGDPRYSAHIELNSDLVFANHSCAPSVAFEVPADPSAWQVRALKDIKEGEPITFFYPSTEWDMAQPFDCNCGAPECLGRIAGAKDLDKEVLDRYFINEHIKQLKQH